MQDIRLRIHIQNTKPIELLDLTSSLVSLNNQYVSYVKRNTADNVSSNAKLYIQEIRGGSTILELVELAVITMLPFAENVNTIVGFAGYCKIVFDYLTGRTVAKPELSIPDCKDFSNIVNPIVTDRGAVMNIGTFINGDVNYTVIADNIKANALQNYSKREIETMRVTELAGVHRDVLMTWDQASGNIKNNTKNKGVIDSIYPNLALKILFDDESIKKKILYGDDNPLVSVYRFDVKVETSQNKPIAYRVINHHETFEA